MYSANAAISSKLLELAEPALAVQAARPFVHLAQALDGRREPREPVGRMLSIVDTARFLNLDADTGLRRLQHAIGGRNGLAATLDQFLRTGGKNVGSGLQRRDGH